VGFIANEPVGVDKLEQGQVSIKTGVLDGLLPMLKLRSEGSYHSCSVGCPKHGAVKLG